MELVPHQNLLRVHSDCYIIPMAGTAVLFFNICTYSMYTIYKLYTQRGTYGLFMNREYKAFKTVYEKHQIVVPHIDVL